MSCIVRFDCIAAHPLEHLDGQFAIEFDRANVIRAASHNADKFVAPFREQAQRLPELEWKTGTARKAAALGQVEQLDLYRNVIERPA